jgi:hypothetical protein
LFFEGDWQNGARATARPPKRERTGGGEKSQIKALGRAWPGPPLEPCRPATTTHDDKRHGTTTLFAAL